MQILTWHEIVNDTIAEVPVVVTFCPLCNASLVFERTVDGAPVERFRYYEGLPDGIGKRHTGY